MKKNMKLILIILAALFLLGVFKNFAVQSVVSLAGSSVVGAKVRMSGLSIGVFNQAIKIKSFRLYNPPDFPKGLLIEIPKIEVAYDLGALLKGKLHLKNVIVDLKQTVIVKNEDGNLNVNSLKVAKKQDKPSKPLAMQIDSLKLSIDKIVVKEYNKGAKPKVLVYEVGIKNKEYKNITSAQQLVSLILGESLSHTALKGAQVYALSTLAGVAFLPAAAAFTLTGKDYSEAYFNRSLDQVYRAGLSSMKELGEVVRQEKDGSASISGKIGSTDLNIAISGADKGRVKAQVTARRFLMPDQAQAAGLLYEMEQKLQ